MRIADQLDNQLLRSSATVRQLDPTTSAAPALPPGQVLRQGIGSCHAHHGEILQGVFPDRSMRHHHALVTLPCPLRASTACFTPERGAGIEAGPLAWKAARSAEQTLLRLGLPDW